MKRTSKRKRQAELAFLGVNLDEARSGQKRLKLKNKHMTCQSCDTWSPGGCLKMRSGFPVVGPTCRHFSYEPGVDE